MRVLNFFPTPVWVRQLPNEDVERINASAIVLIEDFRAKIEGAGSGVPWQTPNDIQDRPELQDLIAHVNESVREVLDTLRIIYDGFLITGCWANIKPKGSGHGFHMHPNNFLSGVYYVRAPGAGGDILFHDPRTQTSVALPRVHEENEYNSRTFRLSVQEGMLILFPAWLSHSVAANVSDEERISISFNIMFERFGEQMARPRWGHVLQNPN